MRIGLVIPPAAFLIDDRAFVFLGVLQIAAVARDAGHDVEVLDCTGHSRTCPKKVHDEACAAATLADSIKRVGDLASRSDVVGCYSMAALHFFVSKFLPAIRAANPRCLAILGGPHASTAPERCAAEGWDAVIVSDQGGGGGEDGFLRAISAVRGDSGRKGWDGPGGLPVVGSTTYASGGAPQIVRAASRDSCGSGGASSSDSSRLDYSNDKWPWPARDLIDFDSYRYTLDGRRYASIVTQSGCPFRCSFCSHWEGYTGLVLRSPGHVRAELRELKRRYPWVGGVMLYDDEVNLRPDLDLFLEEIGDEGRSLDLRYRGFFKSGKKWMTHDLFERFKRAGFDHLCTGAESAHPDVLRLVGKGATVEDNSAFVRLCHEVGIKAKVFTQIGLPGETDETAETNARWLERMATDHGLDDFDVTITTPTSGTPLYNNPEKFKGLIEFDKAELESNDEACNYKGIPGQYKSYVRTTGVHGEKGLERDEIVAWRQRIEDRGRRAAGLAPLVAKDDG